MNPDPRQLAERQMCSEQPCECGICEAFRAVLAERDRLAEAAQAVVQNWRGNNRGWVKPDQLAGNLDRLRAALASMEGDK